MSKLQTYNPKFNSPNIGNQIGNNNDSTVKTNILTQNILISKGLGNLTFKNSFSNSNINPKNNLRAYSAAPKKNYQQTTRTQKPPVNGNNYKIPVSNNKFSKITRSQTPVIPPRKQDGNSPISSFKYKKPPTSNNYNVMNYEIKDKNIDVLNKSIESITKSKSIPPKNRYTPPNPNQKFLNKGIASSLVKSSAFNNSTVSVPSNNKPSNSINNQLNQRSLSPNLLNSYKFKINNNKLSTSRSNISANSNSINNNSLNKPNTLSSPNKSTPSSVNVNNIKLNNVGGISSLLQNFSNNSMKQTGSFNHKKPNTTVKSQAGKPQQIEIEEDVKESRTNKFNKFSYQGNQGNQISQSIPNKFTNVNSNNVNINPNSNLRQNMDTSPFPHYQWKKIDKETNNINLNIIQKDQEKEKEKDIFSPSKFVISKKILFLIQMI